MNRYQLQAVLLDGATENITLPECSRLIDIDRFTNSFNRFDFEEWLRKNGYLSSDSNIQSFQIAIKGKDYPYSVMFKNPYLEKILKHMSTSDRVDSSCEDFQEMRSFLFRQVEEEKFQFLEKYPYQNHLSRKVYSYLQSTVESSEDLLHKKSIEAEIVREITRYKTYRSLSLYRHNRVDQYYAQFGHRARNQAVQQQPRVQNVTISANFEDFEKKYKIEEPNLEVQVYFNDLGEEKEEYLTEEELEKGMIK
jgi:hypothetical protein